MVASPETPPPSVTAAKGCPLDPVFGGVLLKKARIVFSDASPSVNISAELAITEDERARGLMYRTHLADGTGMLFVSKGPERIQRFWMHNTCIPLDMMFIDKDGYIAGILENVPPMNDKSRSIPCPVKYVLEVPSGWSRKNGIFSGQRVVLPRL